MGASVTIMPKSIFKKLGLKKNVKPYSSNDGWALKEAIGDYGKCDFSLGIFENFWNRLS